jgi:hypothetical protein
VVGSGRNFSLTLGGFVREGVLSNTSHTAGEQSVHWLHKTLEDKLKETEALCTTSKRRAFVLRILAAACAGLTTIAIGLEGRAPFVSATATNNPSQDPSRDYLIVVALVLSGLVTFFNAWEAFFDYRWDWIRFKSVCAKLQCLIYRLDYRASSGHVSDSDRDAIFEMFEESTSEMSRRWVERREHETKSPG